MVRGLRGRQLGGTNILWRPRLADIARPPEIEQARRHLFARRQTRLRPGLDGKVLTEWNAMAVTALAYAGTAFGHPGWVAEAAKTAEVLLARLRRPDGRWLRSWRPVEGDSCSARARPATGTGATERETWATGAMEAWATGRAGAGSHVLAYAGDYAWLVEAFTRLGEATGRSSWTRAASETAASLVDLFWDPKVGGFFTYGNDAEDLIARMKDVQDGATPSANATAAVALARLGELTGEVSFTGTARQTVELMTPALSRVPAAFPGLSLAASYISSPRREVVVASSSEALVRPVWERYLPDTVLAWGEPYPSPLWEGRDGPEATGRAFVCEGYSCKLPVTDATELTALLDQPASGRRAGQRGGRPAGWRERGEWSFVIRADATLQGAPACYECGHHPHIGRCQQPLLLMVRNGSSLRVPVKAMPRLDDSPGTALRLMVVSTGNRHCGGIDLASGALVRAWSAYLVDQRLRPYDVVDVTVASDPDLVPDPAEPDAIVIAGPPKLSGG